MTSAEGRRRERPSRRAPPQPVTGIAGGPSLDELRAAIDGRLHTFLGRRRTALDDAALLVDEIGRLVAAGGKRLRPAFCYWGYRAAGGSHCDEIVAAASSLELLHTFAIVHDDIMDASPVRRGVDAVHARHGADVALLVGDLALVLADEVLVTSGFSEERILAAFEAYSRMRQEVIAGQYLDAVAARSAEVDERAVRRIAVLKSGRYSVREPLAIGAALAAATEPVAAGLEAFGEPLGEAFQLRDDLLGTFGDPADTGKPIDSDIREGKHNLLYARTLASLRGADRLSFASRWGRGDDLAADEVAALRGLVESSGARASVEALMAELRDRARSVLRSLDIEPGARPALEELCSVATSRRA